MKMKERNSLIFVQNFRSIKIEIFPFQIKKIVRLRKNEMLKDSVTYLDAITSLVSLILIPL